MTGLVYDERFLEHRTPEGHPEKPSRLTAIRSAIDGSGLSLTGIPPRGAEAAEISRVHGDSQVEAMRLACAAGSAFLEEDTPVCADSLRIAELASGGVLAACDAVMEGRVRNAFCAIRPPGHHAETARAMGFCLLNNSAIAARYLQKAHGLGKILIVDWDVHHGNGTQEIFYEDPSVLYFSVHQFPFYPGTGAVDERGAGRGLGLTMNRPLPAGTSEKDYVEAVRGIEKDVSAFRPDFILVSAGFDAHRADPLGNMNMTEAGFAELTRIVLDWARDSCGGRLVSMLEGGYDLNALGASVAAHVKVLDEDA